MYQHLFMSGTTYQSIKDIIYREVNPDATAASLPQGVREILINMDDQEVFREIVEGIQRDLVDLVENYNTLEEFESALRKPTILFSTHVDIYQKTLLLALHGVLKFGTLSTTIK